MADFSINGISRLNAAQVRSTVNKFKNGTAEERKLYEFIINKADGKNGGNKDGSLDVKELNHFLSLADTSKDGKISDKELEKLLADNKKPGLKDAFKALLKDFTDLVKSTKPEIAPVKGGNDKATLEKNLTRFLGMDKMSAANVTFGEVKENNAKPKANFNGMPYAKSMVMTYKDGTKVMAFCDDKGNVMGYRKVEYDKKTGKKSGVTSYGSAGNPLTKVNYDKSGNKTKALKYDNEGKVNAGTLYKYDAKGNMISSTAHQGENGKLIKTSETQYKNGVVTSKTHFDNGKEAKKMTYDSKGHLKSADVFTYENGKKVLAQKMEYQTDKDGNITNRKILKLDSKTGKYVLSSITSYEVKNNKVLRPTQMVIYNPDGTVKETKVYDQYGLPK